jgi:hypothetical protein
MERIDAPGRAARLARFRAGLDALMAKYRSSAVRGMADAGHELVKDRGTKGPRPMSPCACSRLRANAAC